MTIAGRTGRLTTLGISWALAMTLAAPAVLATPPPHVLERAQQAVAEGRAAAKAFAGAEGDEAKASGLERAARAVEAAAARRAERDGTEFPLKGKALGRGHAAAVHEVLAAGGSPSELPSHGEAVSALAGAFEKVKADHPGLGRIEPATADDDAGADGD